MIVEFCGLPGAGKTTFEAAVVAALSRAGRKVMKRDEVRQAYIRATIWPYHSAGSPMRRLITALYKGRLLLASVKLEIRNGGLWRLAGKTPLLCSMRTAEDTFLMSWFSTTHSDETIFIMHEGVAQNLAAERVWREILPSGAGRMPDPAVEPFGRLHRRIIVHVEVPESFALERLMKRGIPSSWPRKIAAQRVISAFQRYLKEALFTPDLRRCYTFLHIDGSGSKEQMLSQAVPLARALETCVMPDSR
jgi:hypothetical protein